MDDTTGWDAVLVQSWGPLVREAVCERVERSLDMARGVLGVAATDPDAAPSSAVERVHDAILEAIAVETGATLDDLGSQSAWATYDDVWAELGRRRQVGHGMERLPAPAEREVLTLLTELPAVAIEHAGALIDDAGHVLLHRPDGQPHIHVEGIFRWLATEADATPETRQRARLVAERTRNR